MNVLLMYAMTLVVHYHLLAAITLTVPPAAKVLAIVAVVYPLIQLLKKIPALTPYLIGWVSIALNVVLSACGLLIAIPPSQLYTSDTLLALITVCLSAAGVHGTVSAMSSQQSTPPASSAK